MDESYIKEIKRRIELKEQLIRMSQEDVFYLKSLLEKECNKVATESQHKTKTRVCVE